MSISALPNKRSTRKRLRRPDPSVTSLCNQFAEISFSASSNKRSMWKRKTSSSSSSEPEKEESSSNSSAPEKEESSSNSSESEKEELSSNSSEPEKEESSSNSSEPEKEESSSNSSESEKEELSSNSSEPEKEESSSNSSEPEKEESSSNSSEPEKEESSSNSSAPEKEESSSNSSEPEKEELSSNSSEPEKEESSSNSSEPEKEESSSNSSAPEIEESSSNSYAVINQPNSQPYLVINRTIVPQNKISLESSPNSSEPKVMASTSTTPIQKSFKYDVFLSFRGEDVRKKFLGHLYEALTTKGIVTYKDDVKIHKGKTISDELIKAIEDSRFYIIVFSKNYASSSWCLDELLKIMECQKKDERTAYPVFYDVEPTEVRKQSGAVGKAFAKHEKEVRKKRSAFGLAFFMKKKKAMLKKWKGALKEAADLAGWGLNDGVESELIKKIVGLISQELRSISFGSDEKLVGMDTRVKDVVESLEMGIDDDVWMIGIKGMGGAGKTTTARAVFDRLSADFEAKSFVANVREVSKPSMSGLKKLQEQVLSRVLNEQVTLDSVYDGKNMMQERMQGIKVLLVLDDVDHIEQLEALAGGPNWFKPGSRIIVTTRNEQVLEAHRVNFRDIDLLSNKVDHRVKIQDIDLLSDKEAIFLLSRHAFGRASPSQGFEKLSEKVVSYAAGLPLTVKVLGSSLYGKNEHEWVKAIDRLKKFPPEEIRKKLELSYESLEYDYQQIFLDIACILKDMRRKDAIRILECCGFEPITGLRVLEQRSLITVDEYGFLRMHDQIEEMGKNIVRREHRDEPNKHSRLWIKEEIEDILANDEGTEATICLELGYSFTCNAGTVMKGLGKMKQLRFLHVNFQIQDYAEVLDNTAQYFSNSLKYLKCGNYPFLYLPKTFQANNLVGLEMVDSRRMVQLWKEGEKKVLPKLKFLSFSGSDVTTIDFSITPNLETLSLEYTHNLVELFMPVSCQKLNYLRISCSKLRTFDLGLTPNLEKLSLDKCVDFEELHVSSACPNLKFLHVSSACPNLISPQFASVCPNLELRGKLRLRSLDLELFPNLERLNLEGCADFEELHVSSACPNLKFLELWGELWLRSLDLELFPNLKKLYLKGCVDFEELHVSSACPNLKFLELGGKLRLRSLDLELFPNLKRLNLEGCADFEELQVSSACPNIKFLGLCNSRLRSLDLELFPNLERLDLKGCDKLVEISAPVGCLRKLVYFNLYSCLRFSNFKVFIRGLEPKVSWASLFLVGKSLDLCPLHPNINLPKFQFHCEYDENLPSSFGNIEKLISFGLCACTDSKKFSDMICSLRCLRKLELKRCIPEFPKDLGQLECLEALTLSFTKIKHLPDSICMLKCLESLKVKEDLLEKLPEDLGQLECLEELYVRSKKIEYLPDSICMLKRLQLLDVGDCSCLGKLPEGIGQLESLELLDLTATMIKHLPDSICELKHLTDLILSSCTLLQKLPEDIGKLECLENLCVESEKIKHLPDSICMLKCLKSLKVDNGDLLEKLPENLGQLECLEKLYVRSKKIKHLPDSICMLKCLKSLKVDNGDLLEKLPENLGQLECLEKLYVRSKKIKHLPDSICMLKCLKSLKVDNGDLLEKLPENLGQLECLETLHVWSKKIEYLPDSICMLKRLKSLDVSDCSCLGKLPEDIGQLESLERLDLSATKIKHLPNSICMLKHLNLHGCALLDKLPEDIAASPSFIFEDKKYKRSQWPPYVEAHLQMRLKVADYFLKLIDMGVMENKSGNWPDLKCCEIRKGLEGEWGTLTSSSLSLVGEWSQCVFKLAYCSL